MIKYETEKEMHKDDVANGAPYRTEDGFVVRKIEGKEMLFSPYDWTEVTLPSALQQAIIDTQSDIASTLQGDFGAPMSPDHSEAMRAVWGSEDPLLWSEEAPAEIIEARLTYLRHLQRAKAALETMVEHLKQAAALAVKLH
ncbi:hypothetical protein [Stutzerimonas stutzeri]|uniref:hypothetical protein n=1 Tax=Stutzerimonas stutzeri TaxID=316 RepID=UPI0003962B32|nr:hypothetical protein [Stutzerimonas stutzeri]EQM72377.1 hypothetical protein L686_05975 [Stutzerimonas stutzeri MF28]